MLAKQKGSVFRCRALWLQWRHKIGCLCWSENKAVKSGGFVRLMREKGIQPGGARFFLRGAVSFLASPAFRAAALDGKRTA